MNVFVCAYVRTFVPAGRGPAVDVLAVCVCAFICIYMCKCVCMYVSVVMCVGKTMCV
jgi:hypothetical protein